MPFMPVIKLGLVAMETTIYSTTSSDWEVCIWERKQKPAFFILICIYFIYDHYFLHCNYCLSLYSFDIALCEMLMKHIETIKKRDCVSASVIKAEVRENLHMKACVSLRASRLTSKTNVLKLQRAQHVGVSCGNDPSLFLEKDTGRASVLCSSLNKRWNFTLNISL